MAPRLFIALLLPLAAYASADEPARPQVTALRLPDNSITVDGLDADWQAAGEALNRCTAASADRKMFGSPNPDRGEWTGPDDCSLTVRLAHDSQNLYVLGDVRDQFLTNTSSVAMPFFGDDFEVCAWSDAPDGHREIMAIRHRRWPVFGLQFHPESFLTDCGTELLRRFMHVAPPR